VPEVLYPLPFILLPLAVGIHPVPVFHVVFPVPLVL
jgi:hypothetical protein